MMSSYNKMTDALFKLQHAPQSVRVRQFLESHVIVKLSFKGLILQDMSNPGTDTGECLVPPRISSNPGRPRG